MRRFAGFLFTLVALGAIAASGWWWFSRWQQADASSLADVIIEEPPPQPAPVEPPKSVDPRIAAFPDRGDGALLLWAPGPGEALLRAGFADNAVLVLTATSTAPKETYRLFAIDLTSGTNTLDVRGPEPRLASSHRAMHRNADALCWSALAGDAALEIFCSDQAGRTPRRATTHDGDEDLIEAALSPDGSWLVFEVNVDRTSRIKPGPSAIWKIGLNGAGLQQLTRGADDRFPSWSEDGKRILFQRRLPDGNWDMYVMHADGKDPAPLLRTYDQDERWPVVRPGTDEIAVAAGPKGEPSRLVALDAVTKSSRALTSGAYGPETFPSVSPDGRLVSFLAPIDPAEPGHLGLWAKELD